MTSFLVKGLLELNSSKKGSKGNLLNRLRSELIEYILSKTEIIDSVIPFLKRFVLNKVRVSFK